MQKRTMKAKRSVMFMGLFVLLAVSTAYAQRENAQTGVYGQMARASRHNSTFVGRDFGTVDLYLYVGSNHKRESSCLVAKDSHSGNFAKFHSGNFWRPLPGNSGEWSSETLVSKGSHSGNSSAPKFFVIEKAHPSQVEG